MSWSCTNPTTNDYSINPQLSYLCTKTRLEFKVNCLKQDKYTYDHGKVVNIYTVYEINKNFSISSYSAPENCLLGSDSLTKNVDIDKYKYFGYGIGFDRHGYFSHPSGGTGINVIIFGVDMNSFTKFDNRKTDILILGASHT